MAGVVLSGTSIDVSGSLATKGDIFDAAAFCVATFSTSGSLCVADFSTFIDVLGDERGHI